MKHPVIILIALILLAAPASAAVRLMAATDATEPSFPLVSRGASAVIVMPSGLPKVVEIAARDLATDIETITGVRPSLTPDAPTDHHPRIVLSLVPDLAGRWEAFRLSATIAADGTPVLTIAGSDRRGLAYGIYELSRRIGISPWHWWADVPAPHRPELRLSLGTDPVDQPAVRYRGIFLNDEDWGLQPWAAKTFEPAAGTIGPKTYAKIFELMLRLRANTLWPAMHACTTPFHLVPGNNTVADDYAIVLGSSHAEPMLRNNVGEWTAPKEDYNYLTHRADVLAYWEKRIVERTSGESLFTLGMRGIHDSAIVGPKNQAERIATVEKIFADQRDLLARHLGHGDPTRVAQLFCPYKEVLDDYEAGLRVPDDVTLLWPDDNFGYVRRFGTTAEQTRSGGLGVYYHLSYLGAPMAWLWVDSLAPALVWTEMTKAYEHGARTFWIANVGDLKSTERSTEFFLDLAWHADRTSPDAPARWMLDSAARDFGADNARAVADILARHQTLAAARKPEHLQWNLPATPYAPTTLTADEITRRLDSYAALVKDTASLSAKLPADAWDAFFELVGYPVQAAAAANERYFRTELARLNPSRAPALLAASQAAAARITTLTARYNNDTAGGKWRGALTANGLSPKEWKKFQPELPPPLGTAPASPPPVARAVTHPRVPSDARSGDFLEANGIVSINAGHFTSPTDVPGGGWRAIPGLGRTGSAVTVLPSTLHGAPRLAYRFHTATAPPATLRVRLLPTYPLVSGQGLHLAFALDAGQPIPLSVTSGFDPKSDAWKQRVLANATEATAPLSAQLSPGWHTLHLIAIDPGVVVDKLVIDLGGLTPSYDGPPETRLP